MSITLSRYWQSLLLALLPLFVLSQTAVAAGETGMVSLDGRWSYSWGELDTADGRSWNFASTAWQVTQAPGQLPDRLDNKTLWLKLELPPGQWRDPALFVSGIDLSAQVFDRNGKLYQFGEFDAQGHSRFAGWPWHLIALPKADLGQTIYFRIYSDYRDIGLSGEVLLGERADLLQRVYARGFTGLIFTIVVFVIGFISMCLGLIKRERGVALVTGILSFDLALMMFAENELSQVVYPAPLLWRQIAAYSYFLVPGLLAWVIWEWFRKSPPRSALPVIVITLLFVSGVSLLSVMTSFNFVNAYPVFDALFVVLVLTLLIDSNRHARQVGLEGLLIAWGMLAVFVSLLLDMANAYGVITWIGRAGQWGLSFFALSSLAVYMVRDWKQQGELNRLKHSLELEVAERTRELTVSQQQLLQLANEDHLTGLMNRRAFMSRAADAIAQAMQLGRPLSLVLFDVDHFKLINDEHGHAVGDEVLKAIARAMRSNSRADDLLCRYGGEEFVLLLPMTQADAAEVLAQRLRAAINDLCLVTRDNQALMVGVSMGLVAFSDPALQLQDPLRMLDQILSQADAAMYQVKHSGRNGVQLRHGLWASDTSAWRAFKQSVP